MLQIVHLVLDRSNIYIILESDVAGDTFTIGFGRDHIYNS